MYPPKHPKNGTRHWAPVGPELDPWPGDTFTNGEKTWVFRSDGPGWKLLTSEEKKAA